MIRRRAKELGAAGGVEYAECFTTFSLRNEEREESDESDDGKDG